MIPLIKKFAFRALTFGLGLLSAGLANPLSADELTFSDVPAGILQDCPKESALSVRANVLFLHRSSPEAPAAATADFGYDWGWEVSEVYKLSCCWGLEARYFQLESSAELAPAGTGTYDSFLRSAEASARCNVKNWLALLIGFRYVDLDENFTVTAVSTKNHMYGLQIGADTVLWCKAKCALESTLRAGIYWNDAENSTLGTSASRDLLGFVGEAGLSLTCRLTNHTSLRGGYRVLWIEGVALASEQDDPTLVRSDGLFYHGAFAGVEITW